MTTPTPEEPEIVIGEEQPIQIFTWIDPITKRVYHFDATAMLEAALAKTPDAEYIKFVLEPEHVANILKYRGIDLAYARQLTFTQLTQPIIAIYNAADDSTLTVDGHHRYVRVYELGIKEWFMARFKPGTWQKYLLTLPPAMSAALVADIAKVEESEIPSGQKPFSPEGA